MPQKATVPDPCGHTCIGSLICVSLLHVSLLYVSLLSSGELKQSIDEALADGIANANADTVQQQIHQLLKDNPVMLFMKGQPYACSCPSLTEGNLHGNVHVQASDFNGCMPALMCHNTLWCQFEQEGCFESCLCWPNMCRLMLLYPAGLHVAQKLDEITGTPEEPRCGFSRRVVTALKATKEPFNSFDILTDEAVRQTLKEMFDWPTFPQLYVNGELLGGCDIITELANGGDLQETIEEMKNRMT